MQTAKEIQNRCAEKFQKRQNSFSLKAKHPKSTFEINIFFTTSDNFFNFQKSTRRCLQSVEVFRCQVGNFGKIRVDSVIFR